jgi:hypothetical protein
MKSAAAVACILLAIAHWSFTGPIVAGSRQSPSEILTEQVVTFDSTKTRMADQLMEVASALEIPMGIEEICNQPQATASEVHLKGITVGELLRNIVGQNPEYGLEITPTAVHVFAHSIANDPRNYLNIKLPHYQAKDLDLLGLSWILRLNIKMFLYPERYANGWGGGYGGYRAPGWDVPYSFDVYNASVRDILNSLVARTGNAIWISCIDPSRMMDNGKYFAQRSFVSQKPEPKKDFHWEFIPMRDK